jgi:hypothetical protein
MHHHGDVEGISMQEQIAIDAAEYHIEKAIRLEERFMTNGDTDANG